MRRRLVVERARARARPWAKQSCQRAQAARAAQARTPHDEGLVAERADRPPPLAFDAGKLDLTRFAAGGGAIEPPHLDAAVDHLRVGEARAGLAAHDV